MRAVGFNWQAVPAAKLTNTVWEMQEEADEEFVDMEHLTELFYKEESPQARRKAAASSVAKHSTVLSNQRANNIAIVLKKIGLPNEEIADAILRGNAVLLNDSAVEGLLSILPSDDEFQAGAQLSSLALRAVLRGISRAPTRAVRLST